MAEGDSILFSSRGLFAFSACRPGWEQRLSVFVKDEHAPWVTNLEILHQGCGLGNTLGNKGGIAVSSGPGCQRTTTKAQGGASALSCPDDPEAC